MRTGVLALVAGFTFFSLGVAADWPMGGRSADRNPVSPDKNAPTDWRVETNDAKARGIAWSVELGSRSIGGPVVAGGLVWVGTTNRDPLRADGKKDDAVLVAFRETDGKPLYRYESPRLPGGIPKDWPGQSLSGSPLAEGDRLWFCTNRREVVCLDVGPLRRGEGEPRVIWKLDMVKDLGIAPRALMIPGHDTHGSPAAYKDFLYVPTGNGMAADARTVPAPDAPGLVCLRKDNGAVVWKDNTPGKNLLFGHYASPLVVEIAGRGQVIAPQADGWVRSFDPGTGKLLWKFDTNRKGATGDGGVGGQRTYVVATPVYANGRVYFATGLHPEACGDQTGRLFCIDPTKSGDISPELDAGGGRGKPNPNSGVLWEFTEAGPGEADRMHLSLSSVAVHDGLVIATDYFGFVHCLDETTGKRHWTQDTKDTVFGGPLVADGKIYVGNQGGCMWVFGLGKMKKVIAKTDTNRLIVAPPVFANGILYVLTEGRLYAIASGPGKRPE